jgi:GT2 family glycosyltransferase
MTDLSIIIVCYKGWDKLNKCLNSVNSFTGANFSTEVIVVDNRSEEEAIHLFEQKFAKFRFIYNKVNGGFANGCNVGAANASGEFLLFLNPDTVVSESETGKLLNTAKENPGYSVISCRQVNEAGRESRAYGQFPSLLTLTGFLRMIFRPRKPFTEISKPEISFPDWVSGSVVMIRNDTFKNSGGFDEDYWMYFEDVDLCRRIRNSGGKIAFSSNITVEHNHGGSSRINIKTASLTKTEVHISLHVYINKHKTGIAKLIIQIFLVLNNLISGGMMAVLGLVLFFIPKVFSRTLMYGKLIRYYAGSLLRSSWISPRSVNFH